MITRVKFCGITRAEDAVVAAQIGASYVGVILAGGKRNVSTDRAAEIFAALPLATPVRRVIVIPALAAVEAAEIGRETGAHVIQMHADPAVRDVMELRAVWEGEIWPVARAGDVANEDELMQLISIGDALVIDSGSRGTSGGTGRTFDWNRFPFPLGRARENKLVLAGGLDPTNVRGAIGVVDPDVVDVSSGVERAPGIKDHGLMRDFMNQVLSSNGESSVGING